MLKLSQIARQGAAFAAVAVFRLSGEELEFIRASLQLLPGFHGRLGQWRSR